MDQGVGREIKRLREEKNWSMAKLAVEADMSVSGVSMIENGKRNLTTTTLAKLARALEVEVRDLFPLEQPRLPELGPPGVALFVEPEEGEEEDTVTLRLYAVRLLAERDRLLQEVRRLEREKDELRQQRA